MPADTGTVVVIGAGLGGISAAISLQEAGYRVRVYEKNAHVGGKLNVRQKDGFSFDLGPSILTMPHIFEKLFTGAGKALGDYIPIRRLDLEWRCFFEDGRHLDLYADPEQTVGANPWLGEKDREDLIRFINYSKDLYEAVNEGYFEEGLDTLPEVVKFYGIIRSLSDLDYFHTMHQGVAKRVSDPYLQNVLDHFIKYVGSSPYDAPAVLNVMQYIQFHFGLWYVDGGMYNLAAGLTKLMEELGIEVHLNCEVVSLEREGERVTAAVLADGTVVKGDLFVSDMEVIPAYERLLGEKGPMLDDYRKRFEPACSGYVLHLGVNCRYDQLAHHNFFFSTDPEKSHCEVFHQKELPKDPTIYLVAPARTDPTQAPAGCENLKILPHVPYIQDTPFSPEEYAAFKELVLDKLERMGLVDLRSHIITEDEWTPHDIEDLYYSNRGAIYGIVSDRRKNKGFKAPKKSEKYQNLYFVGGSVNPGGGMPMAVLSGQQVKELILKRE
ncbi:MAG: phytoene desaturase [Methanocalculus sp. MSAO_Arc1]|uniref:phytoene desaturase family protein n=1 Tax=Methanocalculus TaxID=71151 RepID=UPI000FF84407|nr:MULTISPECIES: phytoene desaturase family protein [unclassified Methanocalculus]MCP1662151.1 diapolycopene oxygenase [Methanocalculus sp. AMF5]RQD79118.1 MAG: phytoene desaturase [Methanocalculus sp. MSAO_Arc1]